MVEHLKRKAQAAIIGAGMAVLAITAACGGSDDPPAASTTPATPPVVDRFAALTPVDPEPAYATQMDRHLAAATRDAGGDQALLDTYRKYYCMYPENNTAFRSQVIADNARLPLTQIFDDVWYVGSRYVGQYIFRSPTSFMILDALNNAAEVQQYSVPALTSLGVGAALPVKDLLLTHGHGDHDGGALEIKTTYGPRVLLGSGDAAGKAYAPYQIDSTDPNPVTMTLGGRVVSLLATPGHTPGSVSAVLPVLDKGKQIKVIVVGGSAIPATVNESRNYLDSVERTYKLARSEGVVGSIHPHPVFDGSQRNMVTINASGMPANNPFVVGNKKVLRATAILRQCAAAMVARVDTTANLSVWRVTKLELPIGGPNINDVSARLTSDWGPIQGKTLNFSTASGKTCAATTNDVGVARCTNPGFAATDSVTVTFDGAEGDGTTELPSTETAQMASAT
ncbi:MULTISPECIES: MBL fold metallo-hydrolase [unclassified Cupriavidus]|jgi:glyoxylase-like metal-dependent hydrolase (beta-lactamase superfamily II)|uniref:MBL fold metallo-hydrolase n=1 Tax=unclassified Cupriavidus TaxID=2640874 RepID=UPI000B863D39|nr:MULTISPECIES: MBL fold metallo-hydrolase [unclassified Cupriavidus]